MHELSVATDLLDLAREQLTPDDLRGTLTLHVRIGELSGVVPAALASAFRSVVVGTDLHAARLVIETVPLVAWCPSCEREQPPVTGTLRCPACGGRMPRVVRGRELELVHIEVATDVVAPDR